MPRRHYSRRHTMVPDPMYNSILVARFINNIMKRGKKALAQKIIYDSFNMLPDVVSNRIERDSLVTIESKNGVPPGGRPFELSSGHHTGYTERIGFKTTLVDSDLVPEHWIFREKYSKIKPHP